MVDSLRGRASERKLRLFACACCRRVWHLLANNEEWVGAVEGAERDADGLAGGPGPCDAGAHARLREYLEYGFARSWYAGHAAVLTGRWAAARGPLIHHPMHEPPRQSPDDAALVAGVAAAAAAYDAVAPDCTAQAAQSLNAHTGERAYQEARDRERRGQADLVRDLFGNPFRPPAVEPAWLTWGDRTVVRLAQAAYDNRRLPAGLLDDDRLRVLADALEDAGCQDAQVLGHLRSGGGHARGCWAVDALLGKS
jgi:hypothetical protein